MKVEVSQLLAYSRDRVWDVLLDPEVLARVMPGVEGGRRSAAPSPGWASA